MYWGQFLATRLILVMRMSFSVLKSVSMHTLLQAALLFRWICSSLESVKKLEHRTIHTW